MARERRMVHACFAITVGTRARQFVAGIPPCAVSLPCGSAHRDPCSCCNATKERSLLHRDKLEHTHSTRLAYLAAR